MRSKDDTADCCDCSFTNVEALFDHRRAQHEKRCETSKDDVDQMRFVNRQVFPRHFAECLRVGHATLAICTMLSASFLWRSRRLQSQVVVGRGRAAVQTRVGEKPRMHAGRGYAQSPFQICPMAGCVCAGRLCREGWKNETVAEIQEKPREA